MRTKALLVTAASMLSAAVLADVVSVNVVGFINIQLPGNQGYALVANQLNASPDNVIGNVIPTPPNHTKVFRWDTVNQQLFDPIEFIQGTGWVEVDESISTAVLAPGVAFYIQNPGVDPTFVTLVGEVPQGTDMTVQMAPNFSMVSSIVPQALPLDNTTPGGMNFPLPTDPAVKGLKYYAFDTVAQAVKDPVEYIVGTGWVWSDESIAPPVPAVGEGFFINNPTASSMSWTRTFAVQ